MKDSTSAESRTTWEARTRTFWISPPPGAPRRSRTTAQSWRPQTRFLSPGSAAAAASSRSAGCPPWWGAAARPRSRPGAPRRRCAGRPLRRNVLPHNLAGLPHPADQRHVLHRPRVDQDRLPRQEHGRHQPAGPGHAQPRLLRPARPGLRQRPALRQHQLLRPHRGRARPAEGQRVQPQQGYGAQGAREVLHVVPRRHVAGVARFQLVVQALHQLILGSGGDYLHACLYTRILTRTAKEKLLLQCLHRCRHSM